ncbi:MAG TPA: ABC transporter ATP-binding protein [Anaerolineales bacterium]|nr:ABC transporter ATP-binding protein [Anaerolineales bacterium]
MSAPILDIQNVSAGYGNGRRRVDALRGVSLQIQSGEIFGLLGPNGAGKTTLLSCLQGLHTPTQGRLSVAGREPKQAKGALGIQLQKTALLDDLSAAELIEVYAALYDVQLPPERIGALLERFGLSEQRGKFARQMSGGQQQRLALAIALANDPQIIMLDEPTAALDPHARREVWDVLRGLHEDRRTILITTHSMEEAEALCGRVAIIDQGKIMAIGSPAAIVAGLGLQATLKAAIDLPLETVRGLPAVTAVRYTGQHLEIQSAAPQTTLPALHQLAAQHGKVVTEFTLRQASLEDAFLALTGRSLN